ncbi:butyrophilin subfamily 3 member A2-like [Archocentrus centrarchus]|uniref:butyrophilin subfamily 3 member A2-like n=1 Tax=Archocentrus centrarchus TaxID=63155 RepID=UPI0011E9BA32|nr:butyrophilin subfamily 3 member A2-like [Archocentrus centrarchus]
MLHLKDGGCCKIPLGAICVLIVHYIVVFLHLTQFCTGQPQVVGPSQLTVAIAGDDTVLPCHLDPAVNAADMTVEWTRADLTPKFVHVWRDGVDLENKKHVDYKGRTSVAINKLKLGDISLKISKVKLSDRGSYRCFVPALNEEASVELFVGAVSSLIISLLRNNKDSSRVVLQCESAGWYPEPELLWLDGEGNLLPAGPTETLRGPDDLYTVSSRVTVEKRHSNNITCRVQQKNINLSRETHIHVQGDFFNTSCSSAAHIIIIIIVAVTALLLLAVVFFVWKCHFKRQGNNFTGTDHTELQPLTEKRSTQCLTEESVNTNNLDEKQENLKAQLKEQEEDKMNLIMVVLLLMSQKDDLENDIHELKLMLEKQEDENQSQLVTNTKPAEQTDMQTASEELKDKENLKIQTNIETRKKELEKEIETKESQIKSVLYGVDVMTEKKKELDDAIEEIHKQLEKIKQTEVQIQLESGVSEA